MIDTRRFIEQLTRRISKRISKSISAVSCLVVIAASLLAVSFSYTAQAQNRVDLDDLNIKGELLNDNRLRLSARDPHKMADRVVYRENFRPEIIDGLEVKWPDRQPAGDRSSDKSADTDKFSIKSSNR